MKKNIYVNSLYQYSSNKEHPENMGRIESIKKALKVEHIPGIVELDEIEKIYEKKYIQKIRNLRGLYGDTYFDEMSLLVSLNALRTAKHAYKHKGFAAIRPPGHHSYRTYAGFCMFNNVVYAVLEDLRDKRVLIIDTDGHHGNGTERYALELKNLYYFSIHANANYYPGTGEKDTEKSRNIAVEPKETDDKRYLELMKEAEAYIKKIKPDVVVGSIGFDTWSKDPVLGFMIEDKRTYYELGKYMDEIGVEAYILEGGYSKELGELFKEFYKGVGR